MVLSLQPGDIMKGRTPGQGEQTVAAVVSKEDHGYIMDVGSSSVKLVLNIFLLPKDPFLHIVLLISSLFRLPW